MRTIINLWKESMEEIGKYPKLLIPFFLWIGIEAAGLYFLYLAPQRPISTVLAPPIRVFFGERFNHYPFNLFLLPKLFTYFQILNNASTGVLSTGILITMLFYLKEGVGAKFWASTFHCIKRLPSLWGIWLTTFLISLLPYKLLPRWENLFIKFSPFFPYLLFLLAIIVEIPFVYAFPFVLTKRKGFFSALGQSLFLSKKHPFLTFALVIVPSLFYFPIITLKLHTFSLMKNFFPEIVIAILGTGIFISVFINFIITFSATLFFLNTQFQQT